MNALLKRLIADRDELNTLIGVLKRYELPMAVDQAAHVLNEEYGWSCNRASLWEALRTFGYMEGRKHISAKALTAGHLVYVKKPSRSETRPYNYQVMVTPKGIKHLGENFFLYLE